MHLHMHTSTVQGVHSSTFCPFPFAQPGWQHRKACTTFAPSSSHVKESRTAYDRGVKRPRHDRPTAGTARKDNSEFRPNKQLPSTGVSYWNSKALFYRDKYLGENSLRQS